MMFSPRVHRVFAWAESLFYICVGLGLAIVFPILATPTPPPNAVTVPGVLDHYIFYYGVEGDNELPIFAYEYPTGTKRLHEPWVFSGTLGYKLGERVEVVVDPANPDVSYVKDNRDVAQAIWGSRAFGFVVLALGIGILITLLRGEKTSRVVTLSSLMRWLSLGIPALLVTPAALFLYATRPNTWFLPATGLGWEALLATAGISIAGGLIVAHAVLAYRFETRTGKPGVNWLSSALKEYIQKRVKAK